MAGLLFLFGLGFLLADLRAIGRHLRYRQRRPTALLTWPARRPPFFRTQMSLGIALGLLFLYNLLVMPAAPGQMFGIGMMGLYYGWAVPKSVRIDRGFYRDGIWSDRGFIRYRTIGGLTWRDGPSPVLLLTRRSGSTAARLVVPGDCYGAARHLLRDLIARHAIGLSDAGLHLGLKDERDDA